MNIILLTKSLGCISLHTLNVLSVAYDGVQRLLFSALRLLSAVISLSLRYIGVGGSPEVGPRVVVMFSDSTII